VFPAGLTAVHVWFSEPVVPFGGGMSVLGPDGRRADRGSVRSAGTELSVDVDATTVGTYTVRWQVISDDTHPTRGSFAFSIGHPSDPALLERAGASAEIGDVAPVGLALAVTARWLHFLGYALSFGVLAFRVLVLRPLDRPASPHRDKRLGQLVQVGIAALLVAEPLALFGQTGSLGPDAIFDPATVSAALDSSFGRVLAQRLATPVALWVLLGLADTGVTWAAPLTLPLAWALAAVDGLAAHATSVQPPSLGLLLNALHVAAMGLWIGGLIALVSIWPVLKQSADGTDCKEVVRRFSRLAALSLGGLAVTGLAMAVLHLTRPADLITTAYGTVLVVKSAVALVALFAALVVIIARRVRPQRWWSLEVAGLVGVLAIAGLLVSLPPPA
jgi:copper transport protein